MDAAVLRLITVEYGWGRVGGQQAEAAQAVGEFLRNWQLAVIKLQSRYFD
jgi:hypothetical protein